MKRVTKAKTSRAGSLKIVGADAPSIGAALQKTPYLSVDDVLIANAEPPTPKRFLPTSSIARKTFPIATGVFDYFPDALAAISEISYVGNLKHNPGEPLHWARGKSMDHADCVARHLIERGGFDVVVIDGITYHMRHSAALAWRACALLQEELEREAGCSTPRGATALPSQ